MKHLKIVSLAAFTLLFALFTSPIHGLDRSLPVTEKAMGGINFQTTCNSEAQDHFTKGLALLHNMMYGQAEKKFEIAFSQDPSCAMAQWGIAMTMFHPLWAPPSKDELAKGFKASLKAAASMQRTTDRELGYIEAVQAFYNNWESIDHKTRLANWEKAQEDLFAAYPNDTDAGAFYALSHLATAPKNDKSFAHQRKAGQVLEKLHIKTPSHPGLFHYIIHAYDNPTLANRALEVAKGYDKVAPTAPHAQHMPSHIFVRLGLWDLTRDWNLRSAAAAREQSKAGELSLHYIHALDYLMYAYLQKAQDNKAKDVLHEINSVKQYQDSFASAYGIAAAQARFHLEQKRWDKAANLETRSHETFNWDKYPWFESITYFARGLGSARIADKAGALKAIETLDAFYDRAQKAGQSYWAVPIDSQRHTIAAWIAFAEGDNSNALNLMKKAAAIEDSVDKHPVTPGAVLPARELLGEMLILLGKYDDAITAYEASLTISPNRFNGLYGAGYAAEMTGDIEKAKQYYSKLLEISGSEGIDRPGFNKVKALLAKK